MTTGSAGIDSLIDSIQEEQFYLFYGNNRPIIDGLVLQLLVNCVLPMKEKHGFESMAIYMNNVDYYQPDKSVVLNPERIAIAAKCAGIEPKIVFTSELIGSKKQDIKLLVVNNLTKFFKESKNKNYSANMIKEVLGTICRICSRNKIALVCTSDANLTSKGIIRTHSYSRRDRRYDILSSSRIT